MRFLHLTNDRNKTTNGLLKDACEARGLKYIEFDPVDFSFTSPQKHSDGDLFYRAADGPLARTVERFLTQKKLVTFYKTPERIDFAPFPLSIYRKEKIRQPKTIDWIPESHEELQNAATALGGFPLIVKVLGGSHGVGVIKVDSLSSLRSLSDYFRKQSHRVILRQFIPGGRSSRLIVLGNKVVDSIEYKAPKNDFRTNIGKSPIVTPKKFSPAIEKLAVKSVQVLGLEFGGVDILIHKGKGYVAEANYPCFFPRCSAVTGVDIAGKMVDYLLKKRKKMIK